MAINHPDDSCVMISIPAGNFSIDSSPKTTTTPMAQTIWPTLKEFIDPQGAFSAMWHRIFVISCLISVTTDPLFFYVPYINEEKRCIGRGTNVRTAALVLRSLADMTFITHIIHEILVFSNTVLPEIIKKKKKKPVRRWKRADFINFAKDLYQNTCSLSVAISIIIDFVAILPIPQVAIFMVLFHEKIGPVSLEFMDKMKILNVFLLFQYLPKIYRIYLSCRKLKQTGIWARGSFNFFLYILASHVLGAFWYFLSFQRETACWHKACEPSKKTGDFPHKGCEYTYYCNRTRPEIPGYADFLNEKCPAVKPSNIAGFDFGIFLHALESGITHSPDFFKKFLYSFWWGLRHLSSFGQNLETSTYEWENYFAIVISLIGLLLFLYLIGNLQTYMQMATTKSEAIREKMKEKDDEIQQWMSRNNLSDDMKTVMMENVRRKLEENKDVHVENLLPILPKKDRISIKRLLCMDALKKVPMLQHMDEKVLEMIFDKLDPVFYTANSYVIRAGEPLDRMLFNIEGIILTYTTTDGSVNSGSSITNCLYKGDFYGEQLLNWAFLHKSFYDLPISTQNVKCHTRVEAFSLTAKDLKAVVSEFQRQFNKALPDLNTNNAYKFKELALRFLRALRRNLSKRNSSPQLTIDKSLELGYQPLYPVVFPRSDAS